MANSDKNIVITPNRNGDNSTWPVIDFTGQSGTPIKLSVIDDTSLLFSSTSGNLLSISNSGNPFEVHTGSGATLVRCENSGTVRFLPRSGGKVIIGGVTDGNGLLNINSTPTWPNQAQNRPSIECTSIRLNGGQAGYVTTTQAQPHVYASGRFPDNGSAAFPFNQYGALILQASTTAGYNNEICFVTGSASGGGTASPSVKMRFNESGNMRIGDATNPTSYRLEVSGAIYASSEIVAYSDERVKDNIETIDNGLQKVLQMRGVYYTRNDRIDPAKINSRSLGVIAQEVEKVIPEVITENTEGFKSVAYGNIVGLLIEAIKDLNDEVNDLKRKIEEK